MPVYADTENLNINTAGISDGCLVGLTERLVLIGRGVRDMGVLRWNIHGREEMGVHEGVVTIGVALRNADVFI